MCKIPKAFNCKLPWLHGLQLHKVHSLVRDIALLLRKQATSVQVRHVLFIGAFVILSIRRRLIEPLGLIRVICIGTSVIEVGQDELSALDSILKRFESKMIRLCRSISRRLVKSRSVPYDISIILAMN